MFDEPRHFAAASLHSRIIYQPLLLGLLFPPLLYKLQNGNKAVKLQANILIPGLVLVCVRVKFRYDAGQDKTVRIPAPKGIFQNLHISETKEYN